MEYFGAPETLIREVIHRHEETYSPGNEKDFIDHALTKIRETTDPNSMFFKDVGSNGQFQNSHFVNKSIKIFLFDALNLHPTIDHLFSCLNPINYLVVCLSVKNLQYTLIDIFFAGSDTLSSTLGWAFLYLAIWPDIQQKVYEEILKVVGSFRLPCLNDKSKYAQLHTNVAIS